VTYIERINAGLTRQRARISRMVFFAGLVAVFLYLAPYVPRDTQIMLDLGARHAEVLSLDLTYSLGADDLRTATLTYPNGAPRNVRHDVRLPVGDISLATRCTYRDGRALDQTRRFSTPADAAVHIELGP
jgi:hypothetical protein